MDRTEWSIPDTSTDVQLLVMLWYCPLHVTIVASFKEGTVPGFQGRGKKVPLKSTLERTLSDVCGGHLCMPSYMLTYKLSFFNTYLNEQQMCGMPQ